MTPARLRVAAELDDACRRIGFLQVVGHGIATSTIDAMRAATDEFFALPVESKMSAMPPHPGINRGYAPLGSEALSYSIGVEAPRPDLFEAFNIGEVDAHRRPLVRRPVRLLRREHLARRGSGAAARARVVLP